MLSYVEEQTQDVIAFEDGLDTLALAGSLPMPGIRKSTFALLNDHWKSGAGPLLQRQLYQSTARDPGMVVVLKLLPRVQPKRQISGSGRSSKQRETRAKVSWMKTSANMVRAVTQRLYAASQKAGRPDLDPSALPFKLHRDARIRSTYELIWPADVSDRVSDGTAPGRLIVQYVRMDIEADLASKAFQHYKRQLKRAKDYKFSQGRWLDSISMGSEPGIRRSIDVVFMQAAAGNAGGAAAGQYGGTADPAGKLGGVAGAGGIGGAAAEAAARGQYGGNAERGAYGGAGGARQQDNAGRVTIDVLVIEIPDPKLAAGK